MFEILLSGVMGALAAGIAVLLARALTDPKKKRGTHRALIALFTLCAFYAANQTLAPQLRAWKRGYDVDHYLRNDPLYSVLLVDNPTLKEPLKAALVKALETGDREQGVAAARSLVAAVLPKYLPKASDESVVNFTKSTMVGLRALASRDPDRCYRYLFPKVAGPPPLGKDEGELDLLQAMRLVVESARQNPRPAPEESAVRPILEDVMARLAMRHGDDLSLLQHPEAPGVDRAKVCTLTIDLHSEVLSLPQKEAGRLLRFLYAQ